MGSEAFRLHSQISPISNMQLDSHSHTTTISPDTCHSINYALSSPTLVPSTLRSLKAEEDEIWPCETGGTTSKLPFVTEGSLNHQTNQAWPLNLRSNGAYKDKLFNYSSN